MARATRSAPAVLVAGALLSGCGGGGGGGPATLTRPATTTEGPRTAPLEVTTAARRDRGPQPFEPGGVARAVAALRRQIGAEPRFILISAGRDSIIFVVQDVRVRRNVDRYLWSGGEMTGPDAPADRDPRELAPQIFFARQADLRAVPRLVRRGDRMPIEGSRTVGVNIRRDWYDRHRVGFQVIVNGTRRSLQLRADARGRVREIL